MIWVCREHRLTFERVRVMGIINVTPDSFSDGGRFLDPSRAVERGLRLIADGADILDIGGESTRPGATPVSVTEEIRRVLPVIQALAEVVKVPLSVDTQKPEVAAAALAAGAHLVNDIGANRTDDAMWRVVAEFQAGYVAMHMQGTPPTMQVAPRYRNVVDEIAEFMADRLGRLDAVGVRAEQVALDPGIGFGKTVANNLDLLRQVERFTSFGRPVMVGVSRKSFLGKALHLEVEQRLAPTLACTLWSAQAGARIFRTHDVVETIQALQTWAILADDSKIP